MVLIISSVTKKMKEDMILQLGIETFFYVVHSQNMSVCSQGSKN